MFSTLHEILINNGYRYEAKPDHTFSWSKPIHHFTHIESGWFCAASHYDDALVATVGHYMRLDQEDY